jgi:hypothetical protein
VNSTPFHPLPPVNDGSDCLAILWISPANATNRLKVKTRFTASRLCGLRHFAGTAHRLSCWNRRPAFGWASNCWIWSQPSYKRVARCCIQDIDFLKYVVVKNHFIAKVRIGISEKGPDWIAQSYGTRGQRKGKIGSRERSETNCFT